MPGLTYTLKADASGMDAGLKTASQKVDAFQRKIEQSTGAGGGGKKSNGKWQVGNAAMQVQDVAVSLQMGMSYAQVIGQQGSQLLSIFGPTGMLVGGAVAIGAALWTAAEKGAESFNKLKTETSEVKRNLDSIIEYGSSSNLLSGVTTGADALKNMNAVVDENTGLFSAGIATIGKYFGLFDDDAADRIKKIGLEQLAVQEKIRKLAGRIPAEMDKENDILRENIKYGEESAKQAKERLDTERKINEVKLNQNLTEVEKGRIIEKVKEASELSKKLNLEQERRKNAQADADKAEQLRMEGSKAWEAAEKRKQDALEKRLSVEQKISLAKERLKKAQDEVKRIGGGPGREMAEAKVAEAQGNLMDAREDMIQRIMGGSTKAAEAARQEKREARARARAERIIKKRQDIKDFDARARGEAVNIPEMPKVGNMPDTRSAAEKEEAKKQMTILDQIKEASQALEKKLNLA